MLAQVNVLIKVLYTVGILSKPKDICSCVLCGFSLLVCFIVCHVEFERVYRRWKESRRRSGSSVLTFYRHMGTC